MSTDSQAEALKTFLATATKAPVMDFDEANEVEDEDGDPILLPPAFTIVHLERRIGGSERMDGMRPNNLRRLYTRVAAKTVADVRLIEDRTAEAFEFTTVDLGDDVLAHFAFETGGGVFDQSEGYFVRTTAWTFGV